MAFTVRFLSPVFPLKKEGEKQYVFYNRRIKAPKKTPPMKQFKGKTVLITGGASGIGRLMGERVLKKEARLIIWDINRENMDDMLGRFSGTGRISGYIVDVSDKSAVRRAAEEVKQEHGDIDLLINNAGVVTGKYFHEHSLREIDWNIEVNARAPMYVTRQFLPAMMARGEGHICNIASLAGLISNPRMSVYAASKWSVIGWSDSLRLEMKQLGTGVYVTTVMPYYIDTGMFEGVRSRLPVLNPDKTADKIIRSVEKNRIRVGIPWPAGVIRLLQGVLPVRLFDWLVGELLGIYHTMEQFRGHPPLSDRI